MPPPHTVLPVTRTSRFDAVNPTRRFSPALPEKYRRLSTACMPSSGESAPMMMLPLAAYCVEIVPLLKDTLPITCTLRWVPSVGPAYT